MTGSADRRGPGGDDWSGGRYVPADRQDREGWDDPGDWSPPGAPGGPAPYRQDGRGAGPYAADPYGGQGGGYGADPYGGQGGYAPQQPQQQPGQGGGYGDGYGTGQYPAVDPYGGQGGYAPQQPPQQPGQGGGYGDGYGTGQYPAVDPYGGQGGYAPQQPPQQPGQGGGYGDGYATGGHPAAGPAAAQAPQDARQAAATAAAPPRQRTAQAPRRPGARPGTAPGPGAAPGSSYDGEEFTFVDDEEESEDVIDWLKFAETRTERRDERKRRGRNRVVALVVALALVALGAAGYLWKSGVLGGPAADGGPAGKREVIALHLHDLKGRTTTALLVDDPAGDKGTALLLPGALLLPDDGGGSGSTTLGASLAAQGAGGTQDALATTLGAPVAGTWRLDTPYLQILVDQLGGITADVDAPVTQNGKTLVQAGPSRSLNGQAAVAYATLLAPGERPAAQLARFGKVLAAVVKAMPADSSAATDVVKRMNAVMDPSLSEKQLGASLAALSAHAAKDRFAVRTLPVKADGTVDEATAGALVKEVLGGTVHNADRGSGPARVAVQDATGIRGRAADAQVQVVNGGYTFVPPVGRAAATAARTEIRYTDDARAGDARQLALTLDVPATSVKKAPGGQTADILVVLGQDYKGRPKAPQ
ncbi:LCP family protein [Streptacidiphilus sp. ASG 303]|uniref:LCP family protein n=1 Tax=Streptacidiphilus sp. ASG 303 TaxID=2896847 RepID=UPI0027DFDEC3|nr:LCP family protein [Streptacidiphilus sp. ASG 303]